MSAYRSRAVGDTMVIAGAAREALCLQHVVEPNVSP